MKADCFTGFLTDKVKVFPTTRKVAPYVLPKRLIRRAYPFLLASAMTFVGVGFTKQSQVAGDDDTRQSSALFMNKKQLTDIYQEVVNVYNLVALKDKEPFSEQNIQNLLSLQQAPMLKDVNFNHCPASQENFWEIVKNGIVITNRLMKSKSLSLEQKKEYKITAYKMLAQLSKVKGTDNVVDLTDYNNLKTFLYFEKVIHYKDDYISVLGRETGCSDERDEFLGRYYKDFEHLVAVAKKYPGVERFTQAFYANNDRFILSSKDSVIANQISRQMYHDWLKKQNIKRTDLVSLLPYDEGADYMNTSRFIHHRGNLFFAAVFVAANGQLDYGAYAPVGETSIHEISHLMQFKPSSNERPENNRLSDDVAKQLPEDEFTSTIYAELGPSLHSLVMQDQIYKKIHHIKPDKIINYGVSINTLHQSIPVGQLAVWFYKMEQKYPSLSIDKIVSQPEVLKQLDAWGRSQQASREKAFGYLNRSH